MTRCFARLALIALPLALAACAGRQEVATVEAPPPAVVLAQPPSPPAGLTAGLVIPAAAADGRFETVNYGIGQSEAVWHLRAALNVAALGCRGAEQADLVAAYNGLLKDQKPALAAADKATQARYRAQFGKDWQSAHDAAMTRLYNYFAQPFAQARFCAEAKAIAATARAVPAGSMESFATTALAALDAPFTDFYREAAEYRRAFALWQAGRAGQQTAAAAPRIEADLSGFDQVALAAPR